MGVELGVVEKEAPAEMVAEGEGGAVVVGNGDGVARGVTVGVAPLLGDAVGVAVPVAVGVALGGATNTVNVLPHPSVVFQTHTSFCSSASVVFAMRPYRPPNPGLGVITIVCGRIPPPMVQLSRGFASPGAVVTLE